MMVWMFTFTWMGATSRPAASYSIILKTTLPLKVLVKVVS